ncbi:glycosyltransferase [Flavobacterium sp.]|uniref:glycosyltransferase n=1 Tax=Flavobacterium sp. TaxID=239 RepID=UPI003753CEDA
MKILYITPKISGEGGLVRVISLKANYSSNIFGHEIHILTQNENHSLFYEFNEKIGLHNMLLKGKGLKLLFSYRKELKKQINIIDPDLVIVCEGLKGFFIPWILPFKIPIIFEVHGSIFNIENELGSTLLSRIKQNIEILFKKLAARKFTKIIFLSEESAKEWNLKNSEIIPNPIWFTTDKTSGLNTKRAISVARHSYEKGIDRLLLIWQKVVLIHPEWTIDIYGESETNLSYQIMAQELNIESKVNFHKPVINIVEKYQNASLCLMTSRFEGFGMALLEAMTCGLPCIAFDCPCGPRSLIFNDENGLLIENHNIDVFSESVIQLISDNNNMKRLGKNAVLSVQKYNLEDIMAQWNKLFFEITNKH